MFFNIYRATQSSLKKHKKSGTPKYITTMLSPQKRLLNLQKREKLKRLLITKFTQKYKIENPDEILDPIITDFIQYEKLNDTDLIRLDMKIKKLIKDQSAKNLLKSRLYHNNKEINLSQSPLQSLSERGNKKLQLSSNTLETEKIIKDIQKNNEFPTINTINSYSNLNSPTERGLKKRINNSSFVIKRSPIKYFKKPEEELAELEKELEIESERKHNYNRIDFSKDGDEWNAIIKYNKKLFDKKILEEKLKDKEKKKMNKFFLDQQVKEKLQKDIEEELKEKEYDKLMQEYSKKLDEIEAVKAQKIKQQVKRLKENMDILLKSKKTRKRIEELKERKNDIIMLKNYQKSLEKTKKENLEKKKRETELYKKAIKENEIKQQLLKEKIKKEKEDEIKINEDRIKIELQLDNERDKYYEKIQKLGNKYSFHQAKDIRDKIKKEEDDEDQKIKIYSDAKNREAYEKQVKERLRRQKERDCLKKYLDMQIEEKKKEESFQKLIDEEQARIWKIDCHKYYDEERRMENEIKKMNKKNFEFILNQIEENKRNKSKNNYMSDNEYAMNRKILEKVNEEDKLLEQNKNTIK